MTQREARGRGAVAALTAALLPLAFVAHAADDARPPAVDHVELQLLVEIAGGGRAFSAGSLEPVMLWCELFPALDSRTLFDAPGMHGERWTARRNELELHGGGVSGLAQELLVKVRAQGQVQALASDLVARRLWSVEGSALVERDLATGDVLSERRLRPVRGAVELAVTARSGPIWVATGDWAVLARPGEGLERLPGLVGVSRLRANGHGDAWALADGELVALIGSGEWFVAPLPPAVAGSRWTALEARSEVLWLADGVELVRVDIASGETVTRRIDGVEALALTRDDLTPPRVEWDVPTEGVVSGSEFRVGLTIDEYGSGVDARAVEITVNGTVLTEICHAETGAGFTCVVGAEYVAGRLHLSARVTDRAGNVSNVLSRSWPDPEAIQRVLPPVETVLLSDAESQLRLAASSRNFGDLPHMGLRVLGEYRPVVHFDLAAVAGDVGVLVSAALELYIVENGDNWGTGAEVGAYRMTTPWVEAGATWLCPDDTDTANEEPDCATQWWGGDSEATPTDLVSHTDGQLGWVSFDVTADVQAYLDGQYSGDGWLLTREISSESWVKYASKENSGGFGPVLRLVYEPVEVDTTPPLVSNLQPEAGAVLSVASILGSASFSDDLSGVDTTTFQLLIDDVDRSTDAAVTEAGFAYSLAGGYENGFHLIELFVSDAAGNVAEEAWSFVVVVDTTPPELTIISPVDPVVYVAPSILVEYADSGSGLDLATLELLLDGVEIVGSCTVEPDSVSCTPSVAPGVHSVAVTIADVDGNIATAAATFELVADQQAPTIAITSPNDNVVVTTPTVLVAGVASDDGEVAEVSVNGVSADLSGDVFSAAIVLAEGTNSLDVVALDAAGNQATVTNTVILDTNVPQLSVASPADGAMTNFASIDVTGSVTDAGGVSVLEIDGTPVALVDGIFAETVPLAEGSNTILVRAVDLAGNEAMVQLQVERFSAPSVEIIEPSDLSLISETSVTVSGTISGTVTALTVNGIAGSVSGGLFTATDILLVEGSNILTASAVGSSNSVGTDSIVVVRDLTPPRVVIQHPVDGATVYESSTVVRGLVNDIVPGTVNADQVSVTVNGLSAGVANRGFVLANVQLQLGVNTLTATAVDENGNADSTAVSVVYELPDTPRVRIVSGDLQAGVIGATLPEPLTVQLLDGDGSPVEGEAVLFKVVGNNGHLDTGARQVAVLSDAGGLASTSFTLGTYAGAGSQTVEASAVGFAGPARLVASALAGEPGRIVMDSGNSQVGIAGQGVPRPLVALVVDQGFNRLGEIPVSFEVTKGGGHFENGLQQVTVLTDSDGRAITTFTLGSEPGVANNIVRASVEEDPGPQPVGFFASAKVAGDPAETTVSGVVLDNSEVPVPGVTIEIEGTSQNVQTDGSGWFSIESAPVGMLRLAVDGGTTTRPGEWPRLEFTLTTIPGADNTLGMPIYLLPLDTADEVFVDETTGAVLTMADYPGFSLEIAPDSVEFVDGSRAGVIKVVPVHSDKVPMTPPAGLQPDFVVTIQPHGAKFDPPARISFPNTCGLAPGTVVEFFAFDHDLEQFVSSGPSTVVEDGSVVVSNVGFGVLKAGWYFPAPSGSGNPGCPNVCPLCELCIGDGCVFAPGDCDDGEECTVNDSCVPGEGCTGDPVEVEEIEGACLLATGAEGTYTAISNAPDEIKWSAEPDGQPAEGDGETFAVSFPTEGEKTVEAGCGENTESKTVDVANSCPENPLLIAGKKIVTPTSRQFGVTDHIPDSDEPQLSEGCISSADQWCVALEGLQVEYKYGVHDSIPDREDIPDANEPGPVVPQNCKDIITDFTPSEPYQGQLVPPRNEYWSRPITVAHEDLHEEQLLEAYDEVVTLQESFLNDQCEECKADLPEAEFLNGLNEVLEKRIDEWRGKAHDPQFGAWFLSNTLYAVLIQDIRDRATEEFDMGVTYDGKKWPKACRNGA